MQSSSTKVADQQQPQEPHRSAWPERQCEPVPPIGSKPRVARRLQIARIERRRHQYCYDERKREAEPQKAAIEKIRGPFAVQARPDEEPREKEKQRHQEDVLPRAIQVEAQPSMTVDDRNGAPLIGRTVERIR